MVDKQTRRVDENGHGKVSGGKPIRDKDIASAIGCSRQTVIRWRDVLVCAGYITAKRTPYGFVYTIPKPKKWQQSSPVAPARDVTQTGHLSQGNNSRDVRPLDQRCTADRTNKEDDASRSWTLQSFGGGFFCLALPTLRGDHDRGSEIDGCRIINMLLLRFFLTPLPLSTRGCAQARGRMPVSASSPLPRKQLSACALAHLSRHSDHPDGIPITPRRSPQAPFRSRLPFKSHSTPRPPQTPAASA